MTSMGSELSSEAEEDELASAGALCSKDAGGIEYDTGLGEDGGVSW